MNSVRKKLALAGSGLVLGFVMAELVLRIVGFSYPSLYMDDPDRGYGLRPGAGGWYHVEGGAYVHINSQGLRDREHSREKPPNTIRIAVLGDSFAEALQVPLQNTFWAVMEQELRGCPAWGGRKVEAINFGVSGYGTAQELLTLRRDVWNYSPDIVLLAYTTGNDVQDNSRALSGKSMSPFFIYRDGALMLDNLFLLSDSYRRRQAWVWRAGRRLDDYSRVLQLLRRTAAIVEQLNRAGRRSSGSDFNGAEKEVALEDLVYMTPTNPAWQQAWQVTEGLIITMRNEVRTRGAHFLVVTLSTDIQVYPDPSTRQAFMKRLGIHDLFYPDFRIRALGEREGFEVLNLAPLLQEYADEHHAFLHGFHGRNRGWGHWNAAGHQLAGKLIARKLCQEIRF